MEKRTVDSTGLVWQEGPHGEKIVGEVHATRAGRFYIVMLGRRITPKGYNHPTFEAARAEAMSYEPDADAAEVLAKILDPTGQIR